MHMLNIARLNDEVHLYVVHNTMEPEIIEMIDWVGGHVQDEGDVATQVEEGEVVGDGEMMEGEEIIEVGTKMGYGDGYTEVGTEMVDAEEDAHGQEEEVEVHEVHDFELEDLGEDEDVDESEGEDVHEAETEDKDVDDEEVDVSEESLIDVNIQCDIGASKGNLRQEPSCLIGESSQLTDNDCIDHVRGLSDIEWLSKELISGPNSEDDDGSTKIRFPTFSMPKSLEAYKWEVGTYFSEKKEFTDAIRTYALSNGRSLKFIKNDKKRISIKCLGRKGNCKWYAYCSFRADVNAWKLRKVFDAHSCSRDFNVKL
ncbi:hypothetical protein V8G54_003550 [Vigna mungo]|uniref:Transposase MuDR plant domain-containing protein n=1 Tax=Vigna mungo TaxID=3915 RepID=A0AAQ3SDY9_VIGMU